MNRVLQYLAQVFVDAFRVAALMVGVMLVLFPVYKGVWLGFVPILVGGLLLWLLRCGSGTVRNALVHVYGLRYVGLIIAIPVVVQTALIFMFRSAPVFDGLFVYREAQTLVESGGMNPLTYYAPAQIWYYAFFFKLFGASPLVAQLCQIPLAALIPVVSYSIACRFMSRDTARFCALLVALYPGLLLYILVTPYYFYMYTLAMLLIVWVWMIVLEATDGPMPGWRGRGSATGGGRPGEPRVGRTPIPSAQHVFCRSVFGGAAAGWGALTKATMLVAPVQTLFFWLIAGRSLFHRRRWIAWLVFVAVMAAIITPWALRNRQVFGETVLVCTSGPLVFYSANNPESDGLYSPIPDEATLNTPQDMLDHMHYCNERAWTFIQEHPRRFAQLIGLKLLHTWGTETTFVELINRRGASLGVFDPLLRFGVQAGWAALVIAWVYMAACALWRRLPPNALEIAAGIFVLSKFLIYSVYEGGARHHMPVVPLLIICVLAMMPARREKTGIESVS